MLEEVLALNWTDTGIQCRSSREAWLTHKFMREAIMDRHVYLSKVSSFTINSAYKFTRAGIKVIARHPQIGESYIEIMKNLQDKFFLTSSKVLTFQLTCGMNNITEARPLDTNNNNVVEYHVTPGLCRCLMEDVELKVKLFYGCGYRDMATNSEGLSEDYFPCIQDYNLQPFVRVLPRAKDSLIVPMRYYNGLNSQILKLSIFSKWKSAMDSHDVKEEELQWESDFDLLA